MGWLSKLTYHVAGKYYKKISLITPQVNKISIGPNWNQ